MIWLALPDQQDRVAAVDPERIETELDHRWHPPVDQVAQHHLVVGVREIAEMSAEIMALDQPARNRAERAAEARLEQQTRLMHEVVFAEAWRVREKIECVRGGGTATLVDALRLDRPGRRIDRADN